MSAVQEDLQQPEFQTQIARDCAVILEVDAELPDLLRIAKRAWDLSRPDGFPSSSGLDRGSPTTVYEDFTEPDGSTVKLPVPHVSDPTGEAVIADTPEAHPAGRAILQARSLRAQARRHTADAAAKFETARALLKVVAEPPEEIEEEHRSESDAVLWCENCASTTRTDDFTRRKEKVLNPATTTRSVGPNGTPTARCDDCYHWAVAATEEPAMPSERPRKLIQLAAAGSLVEYQRQLTKIMAEETRSDG